MIRFNVEDIDADTFINLGGDLLPIFNEWRVEDTARVERETRGTPLVNDPILVMQRTDTVSELRIRLRDVDTYHTFGGESPIVDLGQWWQVFVFPSLGIRFVFFEDTGETGDEAGKLRTAIDQGANLK